MAWKTPAGQKKPSTNNPKNGPKGSNNTSFPGLKSGAGKVTAGGGGQTQYEELQQNEVMVLQAIVSIYFFLHLPPKGTYPNFLHPSSHRLRYCVCLEPS